MREIKFRVWDKDCKRMHVCGDNTHDTIYFFEDNCACYYNLQNGEGSSPDGTGTYKLMQYTGLKDKNGKEIYEGDIYHQGDRNILYVVEYTHDCSFMGRQIRTKGSRVGLAYWQDRIEVIGNIYENPELLGVKE
jgi:uncharacterized phage protein (TIGR01671 family)